MGVLDNIAITIESSPGNGQVTHNTIPLLHEIKHALTQLAEQGQSTTLDLKAIPFAPGDEEKLLQILGHGEVDATLDALGESRIRESAYPGVWIIEHRNTEGERIALQIEITRMPEILKAQQTDLEESVARLQLTLEQDDFQ
jgi:hydrogenase-1 operon protein HyaF